jgi:ABC-type glycerol-3-phosphate transport system substrate-binding protein
MPENNAFEVGVAPIPQVSQTNEKAISQGPSLCILKGGKTTDQQVVASWLLVKYLTTNMAFQTEFSSTSGYMPVLESAQEHEIYKTWLDKANGGEFLTALVVKVGLEEADTYFTSPAFNGSSVARTQAGTLLAKCMSEKTDNVDALINSAFQDALDECEFQAG